MGIRGTTAAESHHMRPKAHDFPIMSMEESTTKQNTGIRRFLWVLPLIALAFLALTVWTMSQRYTQQFLPGTMILGVDCGNMTPGQAADSMAQAAASAQVVLGDSSGIEICRFSLDKFLGEDALSATAQEAFRQQRLTARWYDWLMEGDRSYSSEPLSGLTQEEVSDVLTQLRFAGEGTVAPKDAYVEITDTGYRVVDEEPGNMFNAYVCAKAMTKALRTVSDLSKDVPAVVLDGVAVQPSVTAQSDEILKITGELDAYLNQPVAVDFENGNTYTFTPEDIRAVSDISVVGRMVVCRPDRELLRAFLEPVIEDYGSDGVFAKFLHANDTRPYVYYRVGDRGWTMDREDLTAQVARALESGEGGTAVPDYDRTWYWKNYYSGYRVGDTFIEISLDNQYMWCYIDGKLLVETPIVTGDLARRNDTRRGCFRIYGKVTDTILRGPTWNDHVDYWMPFDGGIGLHDSSWRDEYGEDIYMADGSHGCINTPLEAMKIIYENYNKGDFVIVY